MRMKNFRLILLTFTAFALTSCGGKVKDTLTGSTDDEETTSTSAGGSVSASNLEDLGLSAALLIDVPDAVAASGSSSLALTAQKSADACHIRHTVAKGLESLESVANMFCHFEVESDLIQYGVKYNISFEGVSESDGGAGSFQLWIDNSGADDLKVYFCEDNSLSETIVIQGAASGRAKGYSASSGTFQGESFRRSTTFDNGFTEEGVIKLTSKSAHSSTSGDRFARLLALSLSESDISKIFTSSKGTWQGSSFEDAGAAFIGPEYGSVFYRGSGSDAQAGTYDFAHRGFFNAAGEVVAQSASADFQTSGDLHVAQTVVPGFLGASFTPDAPAGWDCSTDEEITLNPESAGHQACSDHDGKFQDENCWEYASGEDENFDENNLQDAEEFNPDDLEEE